MEKYTLVLKNDRLKHYDRLAILILIIDLVLFIYFFVSSPKQSLRYSSGLFGLLLLAMLATYFIANRKEKKDASNHLHVGLAFGTIGWLVTGNMIAIIASLALQILYRVACRQVTIVFNTDKVEMKSMPSNSIEWNSLSNVILKDGLLTLDFKSNKLLQALVENSAEEVNEQEFNEFCRIQLQAASSTKGTI